MELVYRSIILETDLYSAILTVSIPIDTKYKCCKPYHSSSHLFKSLKLIFWISDFHKITLKAAFRDYWLKMGCFGDYLLNFIESANQKNSRFLLCLSKCCISFEKRLLCCLLM